MPTYSRSKSKSKGRSKPKKKSYLDRIFNKGGLISRLKNKSGDALKKMGE